MTERSYTTMDKSDWGDGPWQREPDKIQWIDEATGLDCLIVRNRFGVLCGYVGVPPEHPWYGRDYGYLEDVDAHCGLNFSDCCQEGVDESEGICHVPLPGRPSDVWWFGFDCAHAWDMLPAMALRGMDFGPRLTYRTVECVRGVCADLARQLHRAEGGS